MGSNFWLNLGKTVEHFAVRLRWKKKTIGGIWLVTVRVGGRSVNLQLSLNKAQFRRPQLSEKKPFVGGGVDTVCCSSSLCSSVGGLPHGFSSFQDQNIVRPAHGFCFTKLRSSDFTLWNVFFLVSSLGLFKKPQDETPRQVAPTPPSGTRSH